MSISRRKLLGFVPAISALFVPVARAKAKPTKIERTYLGYQLHDDVGVSLLKRYARSLALEDKDARWEAQMMFHEAQIARQGGGTMGHKLGSLHREFVEPHELGRPVDKLELWR